MINIYLSIYLSKDRPHFGNAGTPFIEKLLRRRKMFEFNQINIKYIERINQMSYSSLSDNGMLQIFSFLIK